MTLKKKDLHIHVITKFIEFIHQSQMIKLLIYLYKWNTSFCAEAGRIKCARPTKTTYIDTDYRVVRIMRPVLFGYNIGTEFAFR